MAASSDPAPSRPGRAGERVLVTWGTGAYEFPATVLASNPRQVSVEYDDGTLETTMPLLVRPYDWAVDSEISCRWQGQKRWYRGKILSAEGRSLSVRYEDEAQEVTSTNLCRCRRSAPLTSAEAEHLARKNLRPGAAAPEPSVDPPEKDTAPPGPR